MVSATGEIKQESSLRRTTEEVFIILLSQMNNFKNFDRKGLLGKVSKVLKEMTE